MNECRVPEDIADQPTEIVADVARLDLIGMGEFERGQVTSAVVAMNATKPDGLVPMTKAHNVKPGAARKAVFQYG